MNRFYKTIKALGIILRNPWKLNLVIDNNEEWKRYLNKKYNQDNLPVIPLSFFTGNSATVEPHSFLDGGSGITDMALLRQIAAKTKGCIYFEIGTWRGESVANVASEAAMCYTLNLPEQELKKYLDDPGFLESQATFSHELGNVRHLYGNSREFKFAGLNVKPDLIFIDGDHHYESIVSDTKNMLEIMCHDDTIIVWHDYAYTPEIIRYETLAAILDACPDRLHRQLYHVENTICAILYRKEIESAPFVKYAPPKHIFHVNFQIEQLKPDNRTDK
jgi:predicted O-methyltransferase YrrM